MFKQVIAASSLAAFFLVVACSQNLTGAGATFPSPLYAKWAEAYHKETKNTVNYQSIGSGAGIKQAKADTVDFGATDKPLSVDELKASGLYQFPTVIGGVVPAVNIDGIKSGQLKLSSDLLAKIYLGEIKNWNDAAVKALNPDLNLPDLAITAVYRSDGSGTTFLFTHYLGGVSPTWKEKVGVSDTVAWPVGIAGKGNEGVAAMVKTTNGAIGYLEYAFATKGDTATVSLQNASGRFVNPSSESFAAAAEGADWKNAPGNQLILTNQMGDEVWPISGATFILVKANPKNPKKTAAVLAFFDWAYRNGDEQAKTLHYVPLPDSVEDMMRDQWVSSVVTDGKPVYNPSKS
jgi:phosphate transport system substrate-binding protein